MNAERKQHVRIQLLPAPVAMDLADGRRVAVPPGAAVTVDSHLSLQEFFALTSDGDLASYTRAMCKGTSDREGWSINCNPDDALVEEHPEDSHQGRLIAELAKLEGTSLTHDEIVERAMGHGELTPEAMGALLECLDHGLEPPEADHRAVAKWARQQGLSLADFARAEPK